LPATHATWQDAGVILYLGIFQIGLAYACLTLGLRHVPALEASLLLLLEPVLNPVWTWLVHAERPSSWALTGGAIILTASLANTWRQGRR
jgi:drug/metabolite transporter (DMT)-like permease